jgi:hypothetical protein
MMHAREPGRLWIWLTFVLLLFLCVPYFFVGAYEPLVFGVPLWFLCVLFTSFALTVFTVYVVLCQWRLAAVVLDEEERT